VATPGTPCPTHGDLTKKPDDVICPVATDSRASGTSILFAHNSAVLDATALSTISAVAAAWHAGGGTGVLRVDGYASVEGGDPLNWRLACNRALMVEAELMAPSDHSAGVPWTNVEHFAHGETTEFSCTSLPPNRRAVITTPGGAPAPTCSVATRTLVPAPDGTADTRTAVGVNEQVEMTSSAPATWVAACGTVVAPAMGTTAIWTAPAAGGTCTVTATPATGGPCSVSMTVLPPSSRSLVRTGLQAYTAGLAGSGFVATVTINPTGVSFTRTELREDTVAGVATGYYDTVLGWNGSIHPATAWLSPDIHNSGLVDTIGTVPPGSGGPFSEGTFVWPIPQSFRTAGTAGTGSPYSTAFHVQVMIGPSGAEGTAKEGASRGRVP